MNLILLSSGPDYAAFGSNVAALTIRYPNIFAGYTATFNALDYPACAIPTGLLDDSLVQPASERKEFHGDIDKLVWSHCKNFSPFDVELLSAYDCTFLTLSEHFLVHKWSYLATADDEEAAKGSPIGVQVVGRKLMEEKVVSMSRAVVDAVQTANA